MTRPRASRSVVLAAALKAWYATGRTDNLPPVFLVGVRGYYRDTMGRPGVNDRGIYDDAIFLFAPEAFAAFNANTDPSRFRHGVATLLPGVHLYKPGNHGITRPGGGYPAFRPATPGEALPVSRDGESRIPSRRPGIAINIHRGALHSTSSEGCQTIHPHQWDAFHSLTRLEMKKAAITRIHYILLPGPII